MFIKDVREIAYIIKKSVKNYLKNKNNTILTVREKRRLKEINKFEDSRRKEIFQTIILSDEQKKEIDTLYLENYGEMIPYTWHRHFTAFTGRFDVNYFPELLYIPEFEYYQNLNIEFAKVLEDKNFLPIIAKGIGIKSVVNIISCVNGFYQNSDFRRITKTQVISLLTNIGKVFIKPSVEACSGEGCFIAEFKDGIEIGSSKTIETFLRDLGKNFCIQEVISCSPDIKKLYDKSVNTFRVITYRWKNEIISMPLVLRLGQGGNCVDNAHAGGMFIAVDDDGKLHKTAFTEFKQEYTYHPNTMIKFAGYEIANVQDIIVSAKKMHSAVPQLGVINWDFTINKDNEPVLIEANVCGGSIWIVEMAHGCGAFGEKTKEVLQWLGTMNRISPKEYSNYLFGEMESKQK